jgi:chromosome 01 contig 1, DNA sequence (fragment)
MRLVSLILSAVCLLGCAVQPAPVSDSSESNTKVSAYAASQTEQNEEERTVAESLLPQTEDGGDTSESSVAPERAGASENADAEAEKQPAPVETAPPTAPKESATPAPAPEDKPDPAPTPAPTQKPAEKQEEDPAPTPEPTSTPKPAASGDIYSIAEAVRAGNEYARAQYGVTIDTGMTTADSSYFPGTVDSVAWLAENGGQAALTAAVKGNVDATFACLAAMDGAETVSAYARFNCTARYNAASDEYIVVVLYG